MIVKIKKRDLIVLGLIFILFLIIFIAPITYGTSTPTINASFGVELWISNRAPIVIVNNVSTFSVDPTDSGVTAIYISFNVTDADGVSQINASKVVVNLTLGYDDGQWVTNISDQGGEFGTCGNHTEGSPARVIVNCSVPMYYYNNASGNWNINVTVEDIEGGVGRNGSTFSFTYNELSAVSLPYAWINFSNVNLGEQNAQAYPHILLNNTGNNDFDQINITASNLTGLTYTDENIPAANFFINVTNVTAGAGQFLNDTDAITIIERVQSSADSVDNATLWHGPAATGDTPAYRDSTRARGNRSLFLYVDVPSSGLSVQKYNATWNITLWDIS